MEVDHIDPVLTLTASSRDTVLGHTCIAIRPGHGKAGCGVPDPPLRRLANDFTRRWPHLVVKEDSLGSQSLVGRFPGWCTEPNQWGYCQVELRGG